MAQDAKKLKERMRQKIYKEKRLERMKNQARRSETI